ncbi:hypothetical protein L596_030199 [Steinernema carpocapsae]|uniref:Uncharacterized protein n=1 Tax=Steinernema carpocapsae TaxID=34508 RepID=A0A4U5LS11_STECR|nr:hypothetical protein L596_030199 [Steinernema carpocapsae]
MPKFIFISVDGTSSGRRRHLCSEKMQMALDKDPLFEKVLFAEWMGFICYNVSGSDFRAVMVAKPNGPRRRRNAFKLKAPVPLHAY